MNLAIHTRRSSTKIILAWYQGGDGKVREHKLESNNATSEFEQHTAAAHQLAVKCGFVARDWYHASYVHSNHSTGWVFMGLPTLPIETAVQMPPGWKLAPAFTTHRSSNG